MADKTQSDSEQDPHVGDGALASGEDAVAVGKDGVYISGEVGGDMLGPGSSKIQITTAKEPNNLPIIVAIIGLIGVVMVVAVIFKTQTMSPDNRNTPAEVTETTLRNTPTVAPTVIPTTPSPPAPTKTLGLKEGCINQNTWTPFEGEAHLIDTSGCWDLKDWGFQPDNNGISLKFSAPSAGILHGIYRTISPFSIISFDMNVHKMNMVDDLEPKLMFGILPSSLRSQDLGKYLSYQRESATQADLFIKLNDGTLARGSYFPLKYTYNDTQHVTFQIDGTEMTLSIDGNQIGHPIHIPFDVKYFWIGYDLPSGTSLDAGVTNLVITEK